MPFVREQIDANAGGTTVGTYTIVNAKRTKVFFPPMDAQKKFVELVEQSDKSKLLIEYTVRKIRRFQYVYGS